MKIWHISDTHMHHNQLSIPEGIDMVIHSGDATNYRDKYKNHVEFEDFLYWYSRLPMKHKIYVAGNHDSAIETNVFDCKTIMKQHGIIYLENEEIEIEGVKIWGSPFTPTFGQWSFMKARHKIGEVWKHIPNDADIVVVHGPPQGILDLTYERDGSLFRCGCKSLGNRIREVKPKLFLSGHIHSVADIINAGTMKLAQMRTIFSNGSVVTDRKFGLITSTGNILEI